MMDEMNLQVLEEQQKAIQQLEVRVTQSRDCRYKHSKFMVITLQKVYYSDRKVENLTARQMFSL
jgi:hypothetical protein